VSLAERQETHLGLEDALDQPSLWLFRLQCQVRRPRAHIRRIMDEALVSVGHSARQRRAVLDHY
jgi:hypothetical protein